MIERDYLERLLDDLRQQLVDARGQVSAIGGSIQVVEHLLEKLEDGGGQAARSVEPPAPGDEE